MGLDWTPSPLSQTKYCISNVALQQCEPEKFHKIQMQQKTSSDTSDTVINITETVDIYKFY